MFDQYMNECQKAQKRNKKMDGHNFHNLIKKTKNICPQNGWSYDCMQIKFTTGMDGITHHFNT